MRTAPRLALAVLSGAIALTGLAATPAAARTEVTIEYHDRDGHRDHRDYFDRYDRHDRRGDYRDWRRHAHWYSHGERYERRECWTEWRYDRRYDERVRVRVCR